MAEAHKFEIRCPSCDVSFPPETRRCLHCGGRTGPARFQVAGLPPELLTRDRASESDSSPPFDGEISALPMGDPEPGKTVGGWLKAGGSLVWIGLAVVFALMRACGGG